ncbi:MAG: hypothetical protein O7G83_19930 [Proteobacteria bacterium]|nr:hypothetical protein [Pseudomonadota bacterium]MCZ6894763.1 hypothetical protein [Gammaproteobacteria bacterium]
MSDIFESKIFEQRSEWVELFADSRFRQRYRLVGPRLFTETVASVNADISEVCSALRGRWEWWRHGRYDGRERHGDGTIHYDFWPTGFGICVHEVMHEALDLGGGSLRLRIDLSGHANGIAYIDLTPAAKGTVMTGRFAGVTIAGLLPRLMGRRRFAVNHLLAERGALGFPFRRGTGWVGLIEQLEKSRA